MSMDLPLKQTFPTVPMETKSCVIFVGILISFYLKESYGIQCYDCVFCNDPFYENRQPATAHCYGSCMKFKAEGSGHSHVITRSCRAQYEEEYCHTGIYERSTGTICYCNTDHCNASTLPEISTILLLSTTIGSALMFKSMR